MAANPHQGAKMLKLKAKLFSLAVTATTFVALWAPVIAEAGYKRP